MPTDFEQYATKFQEETLKAVKQAQDSNVAVLEKARDLFADANGHYKFPTAESLPTPAKAVELAFDYATKVLELQKQYALRVAEIFAAAQKDVAQAAPRSVPTGKG